MTGATWTCIKLAAAAALVYGASVAFMTAHDLSVCVGYGVCPRD